MAELKTEFLAQVHQKVETRTAAKHIAAVAIVMAAALLATLGGAVLYAQSQDTTSTR